MSQAKVNGTVTTGEDYDAVVVGASLAGCATAILLARDGARVALVEQHQPDVEIFTPVVDRELNAHKYIVPGLGDFGDRLYGTI